MISNETAPTIAQKIEWCTYLTREFGRPTEGRLGTFLELLGPSIENGHTNQFRGIQPEVQELWEEMKHDDGLQSVKFTGGADFYLEMHKEINNMPFQIVKDTLMEFIETYKFKWSRYLRYMVGTLIEREEQNILGCCDSDITQLIKQDIRITIGSEVSGAYYAELQYRVSDKSCTILAGSKLNLECSPYFSEKTLELVIDLIAKGIIGEDRIFLEDCTFNSISEAASIIMLETNMHDSVYYGPTQLVNLLNNPERYRHLNILSIDKSPENGKTFELNIKHASINIQSSSISGARIEERQATVLDDCASNAESESGQNEAEEVKCTLYTETDLFNNIMLTQKEYNIKIKRAMGTKKALLIMGPVGVGKSKIAEQTAKLFIGADKTDRFMKIDCRKEFPYHLYMLRQTATGEFKQGPLLKLLHKARDNRDQKFAVIFEEITRSNGIEEELGEIMQVINMDDRQKEPTTMRDGSTLEVHNNVLFIFTANDRDEGVNQLSDSLSSRPVRIDVTPLWGRWHEVVPNPYATDMIDMIQNYESIRELDHIVYNANESIKNNPNNRGGLGTRFLPENATDLLDKETFIGVLDDTITFCMTSDDFKDSDVIRELEELMEKYGSED
jgi:hypothetical protein